MSESQSKILLVDDEVDILEFISYNLEKEGYKVYTAQNGAEAIRVAEKVLPDLIILDVMMPEMDGIAACEEIRRIPALQHTIIAFLTARGEDYSQIAGFSMMAAAGIPGAEVRFKSALTLLTSTLGRIGLVM